MKDTLLAVASAICRLLYSYDLKYEFHLLQRWMYMVFNNGVAMDELAILILIVADLCTDGNYGMWLELEKHLEYKKLGLSYKDWDSVIRICFAYMVSKAPFDNIYFAIWPEEELERIQPLEKLITSLEKRNLCDIVGLFHSPGIHEFIDSETLGTKLYTSEGTIDLVWIRTGRGYSSCRKEFIWARSSKGITMWENGFQFKIQQDPGNQLRYLVRPKGCSEAWTWIFDDDIVEYMDI